MNQEQIKNKLLKLDSTVSDFSVILSGKASKKTNGIYKPETKEIILHSKNFKTENDLIYTAIHEFAHHVQFSKSKIPISNRSHSTQFWNIFHRLLADAEKKQIYQNMFRNDPEFIELTKRIKEKYLTTNGTLMKEFGKILIEAMELCQRKNARFEDYASRELLLGRSEAASIIKITTNDVKPEIGFENMKMVAKIKDEGERHIAENAFIEGKSPDMVRAAVMAKPETLNPVEQLEAEKIRIKKTINSLTYKLEEIEKRIIDLKENAD